LGILYLFNKEILIIIYSIINQNRMKMKTRTSKLFALAIVMLAFTASTFAQVNADATVSATILTPITISNAANMSFGSAAAGTGGGTILLGTDGSRTAGGTVTLVAAAPGAAANFLVGGSPNATYSISLTGFPVTLDGPGAVDMSVTLPVRTPAGATGTLDGAGAQNILVGATLTINAGQPAGLYNSVAPINVAVNYN
jgi:hypothetical protein